MKAIAASVIKSLVVTILLCSLPPRLHAWEPNAKDLDSAVKSGEFAGYLGNVTDWLNLKAPLKPDEAALETLLKNPVFLIALDQRQLMAKTGADKLGAFAKASPDKQAFLGWLLKSAPAMDLYLEGAVPLGLAAREKNDYPLNPASLEIWQQILKADPDAKDGIYQKLAIATALRPPGSVNIGAGGAATPADPVTRYHYYKTAHQNKELFPSFDHLTVWEYSKIMCSGASDADLTWAREMVNTFRPDLRADEMVVNTTSLVWRRGAPAVFYPNGGYQNFKNVLAGGGKCGPRSSWSVMVCHAFGIPAIGVGQPGHACVAYKAANPMTEPQPGSAWKVGFGAGWDKSTLEDRKGETLRGPDFLAGIEKRTDPAKFSQVEHLRWFASTLAAPDKASAVMGIARKINDSITASKTDLKASLKPEEAEADPGVKAAAEAGHSKAPASSLANQSATTIKSVSGVIHVEAAAFAKTGGKISWGGQFPNVLVHDSFGGGKQVYFQQQMKEQWADYMIDVPAAGTCQIVMQTACINEDQLLEVCAGGKVIATVSIPLKFGLWQETTPVELKLDKGKQTLRIQTPVSVNAENHKRGIALKWFELRAPN
ncbi:MAG: hypothetical protein NTW21_15395 [Verrucomicrobia bacterium]|nr:hypothetical protein [Verrucomicrobiota bacterium]